MQNRDPSLNELGDAPVEDRYREKMIAIVRTLDEIFNGEKLGADRETGFILLVFPFGARDGRANYMSNGADRKDVVTFFREQIARLEGSPDQTGHG